MKETEAIAYLRKRIKTLERTLRFVLPLHVAADYSLPDTHGDIHREAIKKIRAALVSEPI